MKKIAASDCLRTTDGKFFGPDLVEDAKTHQTFLNLRAWAEEHGLCRGGEWDEDMVVNLILEHAEELFDILDYLPKAPKN